MNIVDIGEVVFIVVAFSIALGGFIYVVRKED